MTRPFRSTEKTGLPVNLAISRTCAFEVAHLCRCERGFPQTQENQIQLNANAPSRDDAKERFKEINRF